MVIYEGTPLNKQVALVFDDGPNPEYTPKILDVLRAYDVKATFFLIGKVAEKYPDIARKIVEEGHDIGNHTYTHPRLLSILKSTDDEEVARSLIIQEIEKGEEAIKRAAGISDDQLRYLRPPYLGWNTLCGRIARVKYGNRIIMSPTGFSDWSWDWQNWSEDNIVQAKKQEIVTDVVNSTKPGTIIALHDSSEKSLPEHGEIHDWEKRALPTYLALPQIIESIQAQGLTIAKLGEMELTEEPLRKEYALYYQ